MKLKSESEVPQSCLTPSDPMDCSPPGSPPMEFSKQENWSGLPLPSKIQLCNSQMEGMQNKVGGGAGAFRPSPGELPSQHLHMFISWEAL